MKALDRIDHRILSELLRDSSQSQRDIADRVGLSQNACWRRLKQLEDSGVIQNHTVRLDLRQLGISLIVFMMIRTRSHSADWLRTFRTYVQAIPEITGFYRIGGDYDYLLKVTARDMEDYDRVYQRLIDKVELEAVTSYFTMETILDDRPPPL